MSGRAGLRLPPGSLSEVYLSGRADLVRYRPDRVRYRAGLRLPPGPLSEVYLSGRAHLVR